MVVQFEGPIDGGRGISLLSASPARALVDHGFVEEEYIAAGEARSYRARGELGFDGEWDVEVDETATFRTRIVVRRPKDPAACNGTLVLEWHNVSAGFDSAPDWTYLANEVLRRGYAWVGVSAQKVGVSGGTSLVGYPDGGGLVGTDPDRYGSLSHPGDAFSYDLFTQIGRALVAPDGVAPLGDLPIERVLAIGESQSAFRLTTYVNAVQPLEGFFDGFLIHSRGAVVADLGDATRVTGPDLPKARLRTDVATPVPVLVLEAETDVGSVLRYYDTRQADHDHLRVWEVAGTAHADAFQLGGAPDAFGCTHLVNDGPQHLVVKAALRHLDTWVRDGAAPPMAPRLTVRPGPVLVRDGLGNVLGGIRTPFVDVPAAALSGEPAGCEGTLCWLFGTTTPFEPYRLIDLYGDASGYLAAFAQATEDAIAAGFILEEDRATVLAVAEANAVRFTFT